MSVAVALARSWRGAGCRGVGLARLGWAAGQHAALDAAAAAPATGRWVPPLAPPLPGSQAPAGCRAYTTPPVEAWESLRDSFSSITAEVGDDGVAVLAIDRPQALNALNSQAGPGPRPCRAPKRSLHGSQRPVAALAAPVLLHHTGRQPSLVRARSVLAPPHRSTFLAQVMSELVSACLYLDRNHSTAKVGRPAPAYGASPQQPVALRCSASSPALRWLPDHSFLPSTPLTPASLPAGCALLCHALPPAWRQVIIITGSGDKAFAAGADIKEMAAVTYSEVFPWRCPVPGCRPAVLGAARCSPEDMLSCP